MKVLKIAIYAKILDFLKDFADKISLKGASLKTQKSRFREVQYSAILRTIELKMYIDGDYDQISLHVNF